MSVSVCKYVNPGKVVKTNRTKVGLITMGFSRLSGIFICILSHSITEAIHSTATGEWYKKEQRNSPVWEKINGNGNLCTLCHKIFFVVSFQVKD